MPENIGPWTKEILGKEMTKEEFLANPVAQRMVGKGKLRQYYNEYLLRGETPDMAIRKTAAVGTPDLTGNLHMEKTILTIHDLKCLTAHHILLCMTTQTKSFNV